MTPQPLSERHLDDRRSPSTARSPMSPSTARSPMSPLATNPARGTDRAQIVAEAVVSAYIHEIARPEGA